MQSTLWRRLQSTHTQTTHYYSEKTRGAHSRHDPDEACERERHAVGKHNVSDYCINVSLVPDKCACMRVCARVVFYATPRASHRSMSGCGVCLPAMHMRRCRRALFAWVRAVRTHLDYVCFKSGLVRRRRTHIRIHSCVYVCVCDVQHFLFHLHMCARSPNKWCMSGAMRAGGGKLGFICFEGIECSVAREPKRLVIEWCWAASRCAQKVYILHTHKTNMWVVSRRVRVCMGCWKYPVHLYTHTPYDIYKYTWCR